MLLCVAAAGVVSVVGSVVVAAAAAAGCWVVPVGVAGTAGRWWVRGLRPGGLTPRVRPSSLSHQAPEKTSKQLCYTQCIVLVNSEEKKDK